jgi:hypothetical protein
MRVSRKKVAMGVLAVLALLALVVCVGHVPGPVMEALEHADQYELLSLDPMHYRELPPDNFHRWSVLGRTSVTDPATRKKLNRALRTGAWGAGMPYMCFNPRHGIHVVQAGRSVDLVICFECRQARVFDDGNANEGFLVSGSPQPAFDEALRNAGVPLAQKR